MRFQQVHCVLDEEYRLLWIGGDWDDFALANGGTRALANDVLSTSILDHVADLATRRALTSLIEAVRRAQHPLRVDYRCDSPTVLRRFQLTVQPMKEQRVLLVHDLRDARSFDRPLVPWRHDPRAPDMKCSFCCALRDATGWTAPEDLVAPHPEAVCYCLCPACEAAIEREIARLGAAPARGD